MHFSMRRRRSAQVAPVPTRRRHRASSRNTGAASTTTATTTRTSGSADKDNTLQQASCTVQYARLIGSNDLLPFRRPRDMAARPRARAPRSPPPVLASSPSSSTATEMCTLRGAAMAARSTDICQVVRGSAPAGGHAHPNGVSYS
jgi:hypothetical protein